MKPEQLNKPQPRKAQNSMPPGTSSTARPSARSGQKSKTTSRNSRSQNNAPEMPVSSLEPKPNTTPGPCANSSKTAMVSPCPAQTKHASTSRTAARTPSGSTPQHNTTSRATHPMKHPWTACIRKSNTSTAKRTRLVNEPRLSNKHGTPTSDQHQTLRVTAPIRTTSRPSSDMPRPKT